MLLVQLDRDKAAEVLRRLPERDSLRLMAAVARLGRVDPVEAEAVRNEYRTLREVRRLLASGGMDKAAELLEAAYGSRKAREMLADLIESSRPAPFERLRGADPRSLVTALADEHPQTVALVLVHLPAELGAAVLSGLDEGTQAEVARRVALMDRVSPEAVELVESTLVARLAQLGSLDAAVDTRGPVRGGVPGLVDLLNRVDRAAERRILEGLGGLDPDLAEEVRSRMFVFEDIVGLDDRAVQMVLRQVNTKDLALALKGVRDDVRDKVMRNLSERAAATLAEEIDILGTVRVSQVEAAQAAVVRVIRQLEEAGEIVVSRGGGDDLVF